MADYEKIKNEEQFVVLTRKALHDEAFKAMAHMFSMYPPEDHDQFDAVIKCASMIFAALEQTLFDKGAESNEK